MSGSSEHAAHAPPARAAGVLEGVRVIDLSRVLAGPLCTQMLSDQGASVIKVEPPGGDETRALGPPANAHGDAAYFTAVNRGKRAIGLDLSLQEGRDVLLRLRFDVCRSLPLELPAQVERRFDDGRVFVVFAPLSDVLGDAIERLVFRHHRRKVAEARQLAD